MRRSTVDDWNVVVTNRAGLSAWGGEDLRRYPFLHID